MKGLVFSNKILVGVGFLALLLTTSCATNASYEKILNSWVGAPADALIYSWGPPHEEYTYSGGYRQIVYYHRDSRQIKTLTYYVAKPTYKHGWAKGYRTHFGKVGEVDDGHFGRPGRRDPVVDPSPRQTDRLCQAAVRTGFNQSRDTV